MPTLELNNGSAASCTYVWAEMIEGGSPPVSRPDMLTPKHAIGAPIVFCGGDTVAVSALVNMPSGRVHIGHMLEFGCTPIVLLSLNALWPPGASRLW